MQCVKLISVHYISCLSVPAIKKDLDLFLKFYLVGIRGVRVVFSFSQ